MICKFCLGIMRRKPEEPRILVCEICAYFEVRPLLMPVLTYPIIKEHINHAQA